MNHWTYEYTPAAERRVVSDMPSYECFVTRFKGDDPVAFLAEVNRMRDWIESHFDAYSRGIPRWDFKVDASTRHLPVPTGIGKPVEKLVSQATFVATWYFRNPDDSLLFKSERLDE